MLTFINLLALALVIFFNLSESTRLCRDCVNGEVSYNLTDDLHGYYSSKVTGSCVIVHHVIARDGAKFDDLGSGKFNFTAADNNWSYYCNLYPGAIGCCEIL